MIWILAVVVVGLIAVLAELLLSYQKRAQDLRGRQEPIRRKIREHTQAMEQAVSGVQGAASGRLGELTSELTELAGRAQELATDLSSLERSVFGEAYNPSAPHPAGDDDEAPDATQEQLMATRDTFVRDVEGNRLSLQRDVEVVRRTLGLLDSKLRRGGAGSS